MRKSFSWDQYWHKMLIENNAHKPGWVALLLFPPALSDAAFIALRRALTGLLGNEDTRPYERMLHIAPAVSAADVEKQIALSAEKLGVSDPSPQFETVASDAVALLEHLKALPERSIVVVHSLELFYRRGCARKRVSINTWSGTNVNFGTLEEIHGTHVGETVEEILVVALSRDLMIVAHAGLSSEATKAFKKELRSAPRLCIRGGGRLIDRYGALVARLVRRLNAGTLSLERARLRVQRAFLEPELRAQAEAHLLFVCHRFDEAWRILEPHIDAYKNAPPALCLSVARVAHSAFHQHVASEWLGRAIEAQPRSFIDLHSAWQLAGDLGDDTLSTALFSKLAVAYPHEPFVLREEAKQLLSDWRYADAADCARRAGLHFYAAVWDAFAVGNFDLDELLCLARNEDDRAYIRWRAALDAEHRNDLDTAAWLASGIPELSEYHDRALAMRLRILGRGILHQEQVTDSDCDELMPLIVAIAIAPQKMKARLAFEELLEETLGAQAALILLCTACERLLSQVLTIASATPRAAHFPLNGGESAHPDEALAYSKELTELVLTELLVIGRGNLPNEMLSRATPELVRALLFINQSMDLSEEGLRVATHRLWEIEIICRALGEPSKDCLAAANLVRGLAQQGEHQNARDFAEEALRVLPNTQPMHQVWRTGLAWMIYGEAFQSTKNVMAGLRCVALMLAAWQSSVREAEAVCEGLNLLARIYRDLNMTPFAIRCLKEEEHLRKTCGAIELLWQLDALILDLEGQMLEKADRISWLRHFSKLLSLWRRLPEGAERLPIVSRIASIGRKLLTMGAPLPLPLGIELIDQIKAEKAPPAVVLRYMLSNPPSRVGFLDVVKRFDSAVRKDDLKTQLSILRPLAEDMIESAVHAGDADRFITAFGVLAQPVLSLTAGIPEDTMNTDITTLHRHAMETMSTLDYGAIKDMDTILRRTGRPRERQIAPACEITAAQLASALRPSEMALLLAHSSRGQLCACLVRANGTFSLWIAPDESWSELQFRVWKRRFPLDYRFGGAPHGQGWTRDQIQETLRGLGLYTLDQSSRMTIIPSAELFLFPFALSAPWRPLLSGDNYAFSMPASTGGMVWESSVISTAPSAQWLVTSRTKAQPTNGVRMAWIGSAHSSDPALGRVRDMLRWQFQAHGILLSEAEQPTMVGADLAIVVAHGVQAEDGEFQALADGLNRFGPGEVANWLQGCRCAVIVACHGGASTMQTHTHETRGLVSSILSAGVRAVVACPWPLGTDVVSVWIPHFLHSAASGVSLDEAASSAAMNVRANLTDAGAWAAMQVFGDGSIIVNFDNIER